MTAEVVGCATCRGTGRFKFRKRPEEACRDCDGTGEDLEDQDLFERRL